MATETPARQVVVIRPSRGWAPIRFSELWAYRELLYFLVWRDVKVRYKQTVLGVIWVVIQPLFVSLLFAFIFSRLPGISVGVPYVLFVFTGLVVWNLFAKGLSDGSTSLVSNERLVTKVYFPRLLLPASVVVAALIDFAIGFGVLIGLMAFFGVAPTVSIAAFPLFVFSALVSSMGIAFLLSAIDARYRDVRYTISFLTLLWLFATPVFYPSSIVSGPLQWLYALNPMWGVVEGFKWAMLGPTMAVNPGLIALSLSVGVALFFIGLLYFTRTERRLADTV